jgi:glycosyltransferase involved in cell wall biosynthesis
VITISVGIPTTRSATLGTAIRSVLAQTRGDWELLVIGQGPPEAEVELRDATAAAASGDPRVVYTHLTRRGVSRARNACVSLARGEILAFLDDDCEAAPTWLETIAAAFAGDAELGVVGGAVMSVGRVGPFSYCPTASPAEAVYEPLVTPQRPPDGWDWIGANFAIRADVVALIGPYDESLGGGAEFPAAEDTDYKLRLEALGVRMRCTPRSVVFHSSGTRVGRAALRCQRNYDLGNGAMCAKQTMNGDPRGVIYLRGALRRSLTEWATRLRPYRLPQDLRRSFWREVGYRRCLRNFEVDAMGLLRRREEANHSAPAANDLQAMRSRRDAGRPGVQRQRCRR